MNTKRLAQLFRERAQLDLEIAAALEDEAPPKPRKRPTPSPTLQPSQKVLDSVQRKLRTA